MNKILKHIALAAGDFKYLGNEIRLGFCCDDCPGRTSRIVITVGEIKELYKKYNELLKVDKQKNEM